MKEDGRPIEALPIITMAIDAFNALSGFHSFGVSPGTRQRWHARKLSIPTKAEGKSLRHEEDKDEELAGVGEEVEKSSGMYLGI